MQEMQGVRAMTPSVFVCCALLGVATGSPVSHMVPDAVQVWETRPSSTFDNVIGWLESWATEAPEPLYDKANLPRVSATALCLVCFSFLYFLLYGAVTVVGTVIRYSGRGHGLHTILEQACEGVSYAPMLCVLFIGARMRAIQLSQGETAKYHLPQSYVRLSMFATLVSMVGQVIALILIPVLLPDSNIKTDKEGNVDLSELQAPPVVVKVLTGINYIFMVMLYGGFTLVIFGIYTMEGPKEIWGDERLPVSPAVLNTILLSTLYFAVYLGTTVLRTVRVHRPNAGERLEKLEASFELAKVTVTMAPMLCILFIGARMRALQIDPLHGNPQPWAQMCFYACTVSLLVQTLLVVLTPLLIPGCKTEKGMCEGDVTIVCDESPAAELFCTLMRYLSLFLLYGGFTAVMVSVFTIEHKTKFTPPVTPAMTCVMSLAAVYFTVYLGFFICVTIKDFQEEQSDVIDKLIEVFATGRSTVAAAPMLAMLFIGARMRANQLTITVDKVIPRGAGPQLWAQDAMYLATWSVTAQLLAAMAVPVFFSRPKKLMRSMSTERIVRPPADAGFYVSLAFSIVNYICLFAMYGGACAVVIAIFQMTPERLPPYAGHSALVPGVEVPKPPLPETPTF